MASNFEKAQIIKIFLDNPKAWCEKRNYNQWNMKSFKNCEIVRDYLSEKKIDHPYSDKLEECMAKYMKWCHDNKKSFDWPKHMITPAARNYVFDKFEKFEKFEKLNKN